MGGLINELVNRSYRCRTDDRFRAADVSIGIIVRRSQMEQWVPPRGLLIIPARARAIALRRCILNGGNLHGAFCHIVWCG